MLIFLKLGGSLITDKNQVRAPRLETLRRLMREVVEARMARPELRLVLGHGSGSFGHVEAKKYGTRAGVSNATGWRGFAEVQAVAGLLNRLVADEARAAGLPIFNCPPSASARCRAGVIQSLALEPICAALDHDLIPLVFGDVALDETLGGTVVSTEDVFKFLATRLPPAQILLAGIERGVLAAWPKGEVIPQIQPGVALEGVGASHAADVTGGMASKVNEMLAIVAASPTVQIQIFSGEEPGLVRAALLGEAVEGTMLQKDAG